MRIHTCHVASPKNTCTAHTHTHHIPELIFPLPPPHTHTGYFPLEMVLHHVQGRFASNPNPVDYGLEVGDYFFAVFGSIFVFLLLVVIVIGFIIHPLLLDN